MTPRSAAPRVALLLPPALLLHQAEEWFGGFPAWTGAVLGDGVSEGRFLVINAVGLALITAGTVAAVRRGGPGWLAVVFATLLGLNGLLHGLATLGWERYSPGTVTGLLFSLPVAVAVLRASARRVSRLSMAAGVLLGILFHGVVTLTALA